MQMGFRWYGKDNDTVTLEQIRQIPGVTTIVWALHHKQAGEVWEMGEINAEKQLIETAGFNIDVVESVNVHEDIKLGLPSRDLYIENYIVTMRNLARAGVKVICYNFMPVFDWTRTEMFKPNEDGSTALFFEMSKVKDVSPQVLADKICNTGLTMPGWEPERLSNLAKLFEAYKDVDADKLWSNLQYFLEKIIPVAEEIGIKMAIHPDDPPYPIFGLPRIINNRDNLAKFLGLVDSPSNGLALCSGSLGASLDNDIPAIVREFGDRIHFAHLRNVKVDKNGDFIETSHRACDGSLDMVDIVKAYKDVGFKGYARPDHGRHLWGEKSRPGYGLYDRALGVMYIWGIWDSLNEYEAMGGNLLHEHSRTD